MTPILLLRLIVLMALGVMNCEFTRSSQKIVVSVSTASYAGINRNDSRSRHHLCQYIAERVTEYDTQLRERDSRPTCVKLCVCAYKKTGGPILIEFSPFDLLLPS